MFVEDKGPIGDGKKHKFLVRISLGYSADGKQTRISKSFISTSKNGAIKKMENYLIENDLASKNVKKRKKITFMEFLEIWRNRHGKYLAKSTMRNIEGLLKNEIIPAFGRKELADIDEDDIRYFVDRLKNLRNKNFKSQRKCISPTMVHKYFKIVNTIMGKAQSWHYIDFNPCNGLDRNERPKPNYHAAPIWQDEDFGVFLKYLDSLPDNLPNLQHKVLFHVAVLSGARRGELSVLTFDDVDPAEKTVSINKALKFYNAEEMEIGTPKTQASVRKMYLDSDTIEMIAKLKILQSAFLNENGLENPEGYMFITRRRTGELIPVTPGYFYSWLRKSAKILGLPHIDVHSLRHMAASYTLANGVPLTTVSGMLGHTSIRTTSIYLHELESQRKEAAEVLSQRIKILKQ